MSLIADLKSLDTSQRSAIWASYLGWTLDAFDYFLMVFMFSAIAKDFGTDVKAVSQAVFLTLAARPVGAFLFGWLAEHFGRRPVLMIDIILFSILEFASGFAPTLGTLLVLRFLFGVGMGGEWGLGGSLVMESIPARLRGPVSGLLQSGYPSGYFVASLVYFLLFDSIGWRGMFMIGVAPALLVLLIRMHVKESPVFEARRGKAVANPIALLALPVIPLWAFTGTPVLLGVGAFLVQVAVQGAWGIVPVHLNELSPPLARSLFPGFAYQLGNLIASKNGPIQAGIAEAHGNNYGLALALVCGTMAVVIAVWTAIGPERKNADFTAEAREIAT